MNPGKPGVNEEAMPSVTELDLRTYHPDLASNLDRALCEAAALDFQRIRNDQLEPIRFPGEASGARKSHPLDTGGRAIGRLIRDLQEQTGRPASEMAALLAPLVHRHIEDSHEPGTCASTFRLWNTSGRGSEHLREQQPLGTAQARTRDGLEHDRQATAQLARQFVYVFGFSELPQPVLEDLAPQRNDIVSLP